MTTHHVGAPVQLFAWNPLRPAVPGRAGRVLARRLGWRKPLNNFGDLLGPVLVRAILQARGLDPAAGRRDSRLLSVGSILHLAREGDVVWGSGVNGKIAAERHTPQVLSTLDVRAVRGPLTRGFLTARGVDVPAVYGDPGLLVPQLLPAIAEASREKKYDICVLPNVNDTARRLRGVHVVHPRRPLLDVLRQIAQSRLVVGSSLHAIIVAESLGIPARLVRPEAEDSFKYRDYYAGTGRSTHCAADSAEEAIDLGGETPGTWAAQPLLDAFPEDLWRL